ncbi:MAG: DUF1616 domain-containing protein [Methanobacterium paludis]|nr:DUF1616 domain-containing protein [Methanobacterium paludis]
MKKQSLKDTAAVLLLMILSLTWLLTQTISKFNASIIPYILIMFVLPGYSFVNALVPIKSDLSRIKRLFLSIMTIFLITGFFFIVSRHQIFGITLKSVFLIMAMIITILSIITILERLAFSNREIDVVEVDRSSHNADYDDHGKEEVYGKDIYSKKEIKKEVYRTKDDRKEESHEEENYDIIKMHNEDEISTDRRRKHSTVKRGRKKLFIPTDLILVFLITALCILFVLTPKLSHTFVRTLLGLFLILFIPGYSLIAALFPKKDDLEGIERAALSFGLSVAVTPLIGLALNYTSWGIRLTPILISLSAFTFIMVFVAYLRRIRAPLEERFSVPFGSLPDRIRGQFKGESRNSKILSIVLIITIVLAVATTVYIVVNPHQGEKFTEFYILGPNGTAADYPTNMTSGEIGSVIIGVVNHEYQPVNYSLVVQVNGTILKQENITLNTTQKLEIPYNFTAGYATGKKEIEFQLYKLPDETNVYRSLHLWINIE